MLCKKRIMNALEKSCQSKIRVLATEEWLAYHAERIADSRTPAEVLLASKNNRLEVAQQMAMLAEAALGYSVQVTIKMDADKHSEYLVWYLDNKLKIKCNITDDSLVSMISEGFAELI